MDYHAMSARDVARAMKTDIKQGLSGHEAAARRKAYGKNEIHRGKTRGPIRKFLAQFADVMVIILLISAAVSWVAARISGENGSADALIILLIVFVNAVIGFVQESRAEHAIEALRKLSSPHATVVRDGRRQTIDCTEVVPGDLVLLSDGDIVPADLRLVETLECKTEESSLTGESEPTLKRAEAACSPQTPMAERHTMAYASTSVVAGHGSGIVVATGMDTAVGRWRPCWRRKKRRKRRSSCAWREQVNCLQPVCWLFVR